MKRIVVTSTHGMQVFTLQYRVLWLWWFGIDEAAHTESLDEFITRVNGFSLPLVWRTAQV